MKNKWVIFTLLVLYFSFNSSIITCMECQAEDIPQPIYRLPDENRFQGIIRWFADERNIERLEPIMRSLKFTNQALIFYMVLSRRCKCSEHGSCDFGPELCNITYVCLIGVCMALWYSIKDIVHRPA